MMKYSIILCVFCFSFGFSQTKNEKETRIKSSAFPEIARNHFYDISNEMKYLKFFRETDGSKLSYEAKFKYKKQHYSVEFDSIGRLEDIEIVIKKRNIPKAVLENIIKYKNKHFKKLKLLKIQKQFINTAKKSDKQFIDFILKDPKDKHNHFEIIAEVKTKTEYELRELTFDKAGFFEKSRVLTPSSYEHALY